MKKIIANIALLCLLALPCLLSINDENPITGKFNWCINAIGIMYSIWFALYLKKVFKNLPEPE